MFLFTAIREWGGGTGVVWGAAYNQQFKVAKLTIINDQLSFVISQTVSKKPSCLASPLSRN